jgi:hypothetical protein
MFKSFDEDKAKTKLITIEFRNKKGVGCEIRKIVFRYAKNVLIRVYAFSTDSIWMKQLTSRLFNLFFSSYIMKFVAILKP